jgi:hypothetical protein
MSTVPLALVDDAIDFTAPSTPDPSELQVVPFHFAM